MEHVTIAPAPDAAVEALQSAGDDEQALRDVARQFPAHVEAWAALSEATYSAGDDLAAYAYARVGYHRGLDFMRGSGWRGSQEVPFSEPSNRGMLRSLNALMRAAASIGDGVEARRCREFLLQLDPSDPYEVGMIKPAALSRRLEA